MEWIFLEALVALLLAVVIVVWTMGPKRRPPRGTADGTAGEAGKPPRR